MLKTNTIVLWELTFVVIISLYDVGALNVDLSGRLQMGRAVADVIQVMLGPKLFSSGRRAFDTPHLKRQNNTALTVKAALLCKDISFCNKNLQNFFEEYITRLSESVEYIFAATMTPMLDKGQTNQGFEPDAAFDDELRVTFHDMKHLMNNADALYKQKQDMAYTWLDVFKQTSAKVQEVALGFLNKRVEGSPTDDGKKILRRKIIVATLQTEVQYEYKLCRENDLCSKSNKCTKALHKILETLLSIAEDKIREFFKMFYQSLSDTKLYSVVGDETLTNELQYVLTDIAFSSAVPVKDVLLTVMQAIEARQRMHEKSDIKKSQTQDALLFITIVSDMDHFYYNGRRNPFRHFLDKIKSWSADGGSLKTYLDEVMTEITVELSKQPAELLTKLINAVKTFLEMTVVPEKLS